MSEYILHAVMDRSQWPIGRRAAIAGWGVQDASVPRPFNSTRLAGLDVTTISCYTPLNTNLTRTWRSGQPHFICIGSNPAVGGPCNGDDGGEVYIPEVVILQKVNLL